MSAPMEGRIAALYRHPVKGFTPERLSGALLQAGAYFPGDRLFAVETGPSGFDPAAPVYLPKTRFAVLAHIPQIATIRTAYDTDTGRLTARRGGLPDFAGDLETPSGRADFVQWLEAALDGVPHAGPLRVLRAPEGHRFMDDGGGFVSLINLASVRDLESRIGRPLDPLRFRANFYVEGWDAWAELDLSGREIHAGAARLEGVEPIARCAATHVDPDRGVRDIELVSALMRHYGHRLCGLYARIVRSGAVADGDAVRPA